MPYQPNMKKPTVKRDPIAWDMLDLGVSQPTSAAVTQPAQLTTLPIQQGGNTGFSPNALTQRNAAIQYDSQGRPIRNDYLSITDEMGNLRDQFSQAKAMGPGVDLNTQGLEEYRKMAMEKGPSAWAQMATEAQKMDEQNALQNAMRSGQQAQNQAYNNLAGRGGLSQGQRERLQLQALRQGMQNQQGILNQGMQSRLGINTQDQSNRAQMLSNLQGLDLRAAEFGQGQRAYADQFKQADIGNALKDIGGFNAYQGGAFDKAMQEWGTGKTADAQAKAARSSGGKK